MRAKKAVAHRNCPAEEQIAMIGMRMVAAGLLGVGAAGLVGAQDAQKPAYLKPNLTA